MRDKPAVAKRIVSWREYVVTKTVAVGSASGIIASGIGIALLLLSLAYTIYIDTHTPDSDSFITASGVALLACIFFIPCLVLLAALLWFGGRKSRKTIRFMEPSAAADTFGLPDSKVLVRGTEIMPSEQQSELLRAVQQGHETPTDQLLRAAQTNECN